MPRITPLLRSCCLVLAALGFAPLSHAAVLDDAQGLWAAGKRDQAIKMAEDALKTTPEDPRLRFALGTMLLEQQQLERARVLFTGLTEDFPDLADPYNNLAVIHAARGEYEAARQDLMRALDLQPDHAQAQENLGDVLMRLAQQAYERALKQALGDDTALKLKLQRVVAFNNAKGAQAR
ncbi:tetratricopeptide repeat protein [Roseateles chitosanitabidus]|jgi:Flp pilus assembly protein TadD|uniref:tetratricopeptide repeat protein n=1 Tax=Roseateles chitosanitabidus TaxID=65048 RepID=UPI0009FDB2A5|nr:tetratricopeptide repeat protein [Roseateles chitosanitabidus]MBO9689651.1 tetratricopeptide repeat protein [Roseateles chitosanitabidus]